MSTTNSNPPWTLERLQQIFEPLQNFTCPFTLDDSPHLASVHCKFEENPLAAIVYISIYMEEGNVMYADHHLAAFPIDETMADWMAFIPARIKGACLNGDITLRHIAGHRMIQSQTRDLLMIGTETSGTITFEPLKDAIEQNAPSTQLLEIARNLSTRVNSFEKEKQEEGSEEEDEDEASASEVEPDVSNPEPAPRPPLAQKCKMTDGELAEFHKRRQAVEDQVKAFSTEKKKTLEILVA